MKIKLFFGELPKVETDFNEWAKSDTVFLKDVKIACAVSGLSIPTGAPSLGGTRLAIGAQMGVQVQMIQMFVLLAMYEERKGESNETGKVL